MNNGTEVGKTRYLLSEAMLQTYQDFIKREFGVEVDAVNDELNDRYVFIDRAKKNIAVAILNFDSDLGKYLPLQINPNLKGLLEKESEHHVHFELNKKSLGVGVTSEGMNNLNKVGAVHNKDNNSGKIEIPMWSVTSANDVLLMEWLDYVMLKIKGICDDQENANVKSFYDFYYKTYYSQVLFAYYNYVDQVNSLVGYELKKELIAQYHEEFRKTCQSFNEVLKTNEYFRNISFVKSAFAYGFMYAADGSLFSNDNVKLLGEVKKGDNLVFYVDKEPKEYIIYVPLRFIDDKSNLEDIKNISGDMYVSSSYLK